MIDITQTTNQEKEKKREKFKSHPKLTHRRNPQI